MSGGALEHLAEVPPWPHKGSGSPRCSPTTKHLPYAHQQLELHDPAAETYKGSLNISSRKLEMFPYCSPEAQFLPFAERPPGTCVTRKCARLHLQTENQGLLGREPCRVGCGLCVLIEHPWLCKRGRVVPTNHGPVSLAFFPSRWANLWLCLLII